MMTKKWMKRLAVSLILVVVALSSFAVAGATQDCSTLTIKSIWPALVELDPYTLLVKDRNSFWEINKSTASIYGDYAWGLSGLPTTNGPDIYFLHSTENFTGNTNIYRLNMGTGKSTLYLSLNVRAYGLAQKGNQFYIAYYDSVEKKNVVQRVGGEKPFFQKSSVPSIMSLTLREITSSPLRRNWALIRYSRSPWMHRGISPAHTHTVWQ